MPPLASATNDDADLARWYRDEVLVHEVALRGYLKHAFPVVADVDDVVQESFARVLAAQRKSTGPMRSPRGFLFATARHAAIDLLRRRKIVIIDSLAEIEALSVCDDAPGVAETVARRHDLAELQQAIQSLPDRCRDVLILRKIEGLSQKEIAARLGISEHTVEAQIGIGMRRCAEFLRRRGVTGEHGA